MRLSLAQCWTFLTAGERGVLSTCNQHDTIDAVPVCFAVVGETVVRSEEHTSELQSPC